MVTKVGINGFGRVGRIVFRTCFQHPDIEITALNDPAVDIEYICYLIKFDSTHGKLPADVSHKGSEIKINDRRIKVYHHKLPGGIPWNEAGVQYVVEASGMFSTLEKASGHLTNDGVKRVMLTAPSVDVPMLVLGVNDDFITADMKVLSCGSSTLYCLAPIMKVLVDSFGVEDGFITSIHAMTPSLKPLDGLCLRGKHWREHRSITQNIIPATTGACKALSKIIPQVKDKLTGLAFRVPIVNVSVLDVTVRLTNDTTLDAIVQEVNKASQCAMLNTIKTSNEENVSSDFIGDIHSCILDANSSLQLKPNYFKLICWYENEYSYACRVVDSILFSEKQFSQSNLPPSKTITTYVRTKSLKKQDMLQQTDFCIKELNEVRPTPEREFLENEINISPRALRKTLENSKMPESTTFQNNEGVFTISREDTKLVKNTPSKNVNSLLKPIVPQPPNRQVDCTKAQERLEKVKKEFYKMVDMTEGLLKKTNSSKYTLSTVVKDANKHDRNSSHDVVTDIESASLKTWTNESSNDEVTDIESASLKTWTNESPNDIVTDIESASLKTRTNESSQDLVTDIESASLKTRTNECSHDVLTDIESASLKTRTNESSHDVVTDIESASNKTWTNESSSSRNVLEKTQLPGNVNVKGDCNANSKDSNNTLMELSKEEIVNSIVYDKESAYSVKEMKKFFDSNTQHFLHLRYCERSPERDVKPVTAAERPFNSPESHCKKLNILKAQIVKQNEVDQPLVSADHSCMKNCPNSNTQQLNDNILKSNNIYQIKRRVVDENIESPLNNIKTQEIKGNNDKPVVGDHSDKNIDKYLTENHRSVSPKRSIIVDHKKSEGIHIQTHKSTESKDKQVIECGHPLLSTRNTGSTSKVPILIEIPSRQPRQALIDKSVTLTFLPKQTQSHAIENKMPESSNLSSTASSQLNKTEDHVPAIRNSKNIVSKTLSSLLDGLSKNFQFQSFPGKEKLNTNTLKEDTLNSVTEKIDVPDLKTNELSAVAENLKKHKIVEKEISCDNHKSRSEKHNLKHILGMSMRNLNLANSRGDTKPQHDLVNKEKYTPCSSSESLRNSFSVNEKKNDKSKVPLISNVIREVPNEDEDTKIDIKSVECSQPQNRTESQINVENCNVPRNKGEAIPHNGEYCDGDGNKNKLLTNIKEQPQKSDLAETDTTMSCSSQSRYKFEPTNLNDRLNITSSIETLSEELKKRNIQLVHDTKKNQEVELRAAKVEDYLQEIETFNRCINSVQRPTSSRCSSPLSSYAERVYKEDLYDKLDSTSASDSEMSVHLGGRKSQVINIKDLTSSLDDLERLDKICRIIEISDELSDKLFSNLDKETDASHEKTAKKWSFKDLCEKIKLDEFCNNVFGK